MIGTISVCFSQIDEDQFTMDMDSLIRLTDDEFKPIIASETHKKDGETFYEVTFLPSGSKRGTVSIDEENYRSYFCYFELSTNTLAATELEKISRLVAEAGEKHGLAMSSGTDVKYKNFKAVRIEFDSDNIDDLGKHPSFTIGILKNAPTVEVILTEPLWK